MTVLRSANDIASLALERVGVFPAVDSGPAPEQMSRALTRLDLLVGELSGTMRCLWLVKGLEVVPLTPNVGEFDLITQAAGAIDAKSVQFVFDVKLRYTTSGDDYPIERVDQRGWDAVKAKTQTGIGFNGPPNVVFIDRTPLLPRVFIHPVPAVTGFSLVVAYQTYAPDLSDREGGVQTGLEVAWHRWAEYALAADIGSGPVVSLPISRVQHYAAVAEKSKGKLIAFNAKSGVYPVRTRFRDF